MHFPENPLPVQLSAYWSLILQFHIIRAITHYHKNLVSISFTSWFMVIPLPGSFYLPIFSPPAPMAKTIYGKSIRKGGTRLMFRYILAGGQCGFLQFARRKIMERPFNEYGCSIARRNVFYHLVASDTQTLSTKRVSGSINLIR